MAGNERTTSNDSHTEWMWCLYCQRVFLSEDLIEDWHGEQHSCPFCGSSGLDVDIYRWDTWLQRYPRLLAHWPRTVALLERGMRLPLQASLST